MTSSGDFVTVVHLHWFGNWFFNIFTFLCVLQLSCSPIILTIMMLTHFYNNSKFLILLCLWCHNYWQDFPAALLQVWRFQMNISSFEHQSWFMINLANDNYQHLLDFFDNPLDIFVEGPGGARRCCVPYMQGHVPAQCHHEEWCSKYDNDVNMMTIYPVYSLM